jgi:hypothetical protein
MKSTEDKSWGYEDELVGLNGQKELRVVLYSKWMEC